MIKIDTREYRELTGERPRGYGCWVFEIQYPNEAFVELFTARSGDYVDAAAEARTRTRVVAGEHGRAVVCP